MTEAHIRSDEGIKRGPRTRRSVPRQQDPRTGRMLRIIPKDLDPHVVLERYLTDETTSQIARSFGVTRKALVGWLRDQVPEEWKRVQIIRALVRKDDGNDGLEVAPDALSLARARDMIKSAQFDLSVLDSATWGEKRELLIDQRVTVESSLIEDAKLLLTRIRGAVQQPSQVIDVQADTVQHELDKPA